MCKVYKTERVARVRTRGATSVAGEWGVKERIEARMSGSWLATVGSLAFSLRTAKKPLKVCT